MNECVCVYIYIYIYMYHVCSIYVYGQDRGTAGKVHFDCAGPVFYAFWDVGGMAELLTRFVSKTRKKTKPLILNPQNISKPKSDTKP